MSLSYLVEQIRQNNLEEFVAPLPAGNIELLSVQGGYPYWFDVMNNEPGWKRLKPIQTLVGGRMNRKGINHVEIVGQAQPYEIEEYLNQLPHFHVIALYPNSEGSWLCLPYSKADAKQRGWDGSPKVFTLCPENIEPLDVVRVANLAGSFIYHDMSKLVLEAFRAKELLRQTENETSLNPEFWQAFKMCIERLNMLRQKERVKTLDDRLVESLGFVGAELISYQEVDGGFEVTYKYEGMTWTLPRVGSDLRIQVAGICLSGRDYEHSLSSIVNVMHEARKKRRFDLPREYYL